ncbi:hypothetical protein Taro_054404 [Colocasia esculenta]|uniref:Uncharacterized protein n=1 Tax=Colocasia esculenta TaxID=4460 RepID=A0A843XPY4_COLES|nr:hypothetical protein [Colocasia esculenta]
MNCLTKVGLALLVVFVAFLVAFAAELIFVLYRRRRPRRAPPAAADPELASPAAAAVPGGSPTPKQVLLHFLFWKQNHSCVEPASAAASAAPLFSLSKATTFPLPSAEGAAETELELARWRALYASRVLFTIREDEKEGVDSDGGRSPQRGRPAGAGVSVFRHRGREEQEEEVEVTGAAPELTPFSTPCASPPFYTPPPSPARGVEAGADVAVGSESDGDEFLPSSESDKRQQRVG